MEPRVIRQLISKADAKLSRQRAAVEQTEAELQILIAQLEVAEKNAQQTDAFKTPDKK